MEVGTEEIETRAQDIVDEVKKDNISCLQEFIYLLREKIDSAEMYLDQLRRESEE